MVNVDKVIVLQYIYIYIYIKRRKKVNINILSIFWNDMFYLKRNKLMENYIYFSKYTF